MYFSRRYLWGAITGLLLILALVGCDTFTGSDQIADLETRNAQLQGTIEVMGTPALTIAALEQSATQYVISQAQLTESAVNLLEAESTLTVLELTGGGAAVAAAPSANGAATPPPAAPPGDQPAAVPTPSPSATQQVTTFSGTVIATGLDDADCPVGTSSTVDNTTPELYVNTRIDRLFANSQISARWYVNGELYFDDVQCWIPEQDWVNICAYCSVAPDGETFPVGSWTAELYLDGQLMSEVRFQVFDSAAAPADDSGSDLQ